jgi:hypothetical protein
MIKLDPIAGHGLCCSLSGFCKLSGNGNIKVPKRIQLEDR